MFRIWLEYSLPTAYAPLLEGVAVAVEGEDDLHQAEAVIAGARRFYDGALMDRAPGLKVICRTGIGIDNICVPDATARRVAVCNTPDAPTFSTAEHTLLLILAVAKQIKRAEASMAGEDGSAFFHSHSGLELWGKCLGLVGLGRIGGRVAIAARALGMTVIGYDPFAPPGRAAEVGAEAIPSFESLLGRADIVSLHLPVSPETRRLINADTLAMIKPGAILINAARGGLVDEAALLDALARGRLAGAGLDVFDPEPPSPDNPLLHRSDVIATPHIASATGASQERLWQTALCQALMVLRGVRPPHLVNPEVWPVQGDNQ
ncbi:MAG: hydroxyacid dehydrogenase [Armatimonadetes bacterium]|nr:hydroxyacid dehydrogenase [Armatimonadota bacterium]